MSDYIQLVIQHMTKGIGEMRDNFKNQLGEAPGREKVSPEKQMEAYNNLTAEDIGQLTAEHGTEAGKWFMVMEARKRRSENAKNTL